MSETLDSSIVDDSVNVEKTIEADSVETAENEKSERLTRLPMARIRTLIKADQDVSIASLESVFLITKATELFIETLAKEMHKVTQGQKRKTVYKKDMDSVIEVLDEYSFLEGALE